MMLTDKYLTTKVYKERGARAARPLVLVYVWVNWHKRTNKMTPRRLIVRCAGLVTTKLKDTHWPLFFTITYRDDVEWESKQISNFIKNYREFVKRKHDKKHKLTYIWTAENNKDREYIHYHGLIWIPNGLLPPKPDKQGWWNHGYSNVQRARNPAAYIAKYIGKSSEPLKLPKRARTYTINVRNLMDISYLRAPSWLWYFSKFGDKLKRVKGYGWVNFTTGKYYSSPWYFSNVYGLKWRGWPGNQPGTENFKFCGDENLYDPSAFPCGKLLNHMDKFLISIGEVPEPVYQGQPDKKIPFFS